MHKEVTILIADDDDGHAGLIKRNLERGGISNPVIRFRDGQEVLDYLLCPQESGDCREAARAYVLLLDIRMPKLDGVEVLRRIKASPALQRLPVIMVTTTEEPHEIERCYDQGCSSYVCKPVEYDDFVNAIRQLGLFLQVVEIPQLDDNAGNLSKGSGI